jgi:hypothetical protein
MGWSQRVPWVRPGTVVAVACLVAALVAPPVALLRWRETRLAELSRPEVQANWDAFRAEMRSQSDRSGPVQRKVPRSAEPPELVWLRDYLVLAVTAWVLFVGVLGSVLLALVLGVARDRVTSRAPAVPSPRPPEKE